MEHKPLKIFKIRKLAGSVGSICGGLSPFTDNAKQITMENTELEDLFMTYAGHAPEKTEILTSSGSNRVYYRLSGGGFSAIGVAGTVAKENEVFCAMARHFASKGINVPRIYAVSGDGMYYLQEDLGRESLFDRLSAGRQSGKYSPGDEALLKKTVSMLPDIQIRGAEGWDFSGCLYDKGFDRRSVMFDLNYFKYCFLKTSGLEFDENRLEDDFEKLAGLLLHYDDNAFMYRDFQSRNVMMRGDEPYFIDFQGGRRGPVYYDLASFVWQARSDFPQSLKDVLVDEYVRALGKYRKVDDAEFRKALRLFVLFRTLQVLGAYGFRGGFERKSHFMESIPYAVANLKEALPVAAGACPYMTDVLERLAGLPRFGKKDVRSAAARNRLHVRIFSFSYRKGIPEDASGNGGGYVFDCRAIHNPGKYEQYKALTGMDREVKDFLEKCGETAAFLSNICALADAHVEKYIGRGFTDLMFSFGCTGGRHRSVYCAEALTGHLHSKYGNIDITLVHREQGIEKRF